MLHDSPSTVRTGKSWLDRGLSLSADVRAGEGATALLMLANIFLLLVCYSVIKTVREPLILLGGGAEVRSYAAAGQALLLMGFVPLYGWLASRFDRAKLLVAVTLFFIVCIELFAAAVAARVPYVGVAFFIWVGIFNISLVAQFWSFANDIYSKDAGERLFPIIVIGMTAGAPLGSFVAGRLFRLGIAPQSILQIAAVLLSLTVLFYLWINAREERRNSVAPGLSAEGGFQLVLGNRYLRLIAVAVMLLNVVNTTGEYLIARLLTAEVSQLALANPGFNQQAYIGAFSGDYQFWVNVVAFGLQAFVTSRLVKHTGLRGVLLALPLIALGGYAVVAAGVGFSVVRWIKTAENATDYSIMNTARQLLWLPTSREEKYKAKQAIDTFFVRAGDLLSAGAVFLGANVLHLTVQQFALGNIVLTLVWIGVALMILEPEREISMPFRPLVRAAAVVLAVLALATPALAQTGRERELAAQQAEKAGRLHPYEPNSLERRLGTVDSALAILSKDGAYPFVGTMFAGSGIGVGPGYRGRFRDTGWFDAHAAWSINNYRALDATLKLPAFADRRVSIELRGNRIDAPTVAFFGIGNDTSSDNRTDFSYRGTTVGVSTRVQAARFFSIGAGLDAIQTETTPGQLALNIPANNPNYRRSRLFAEVDTRTSPGYTKHGGLYRVEWADHRQTNGDGSNFRRTDAEVRQFIPLARESSVIAFRALASSTTTGAGQELPFFLMPALGGGELLRGYPSWRFRDRNRLLLTAEYRWSAGPFLDMSVFADAGQVAPRFDSFAWRSFTKTYGVGVSLHTLTNTVTRIEVARTREGTTLLFSFGPSF